LHGAELNPFLVVFALNDPIDVDTGRVNLIRIELAHFNQLLDFSDTDVATGGDHRIEIPRGLSVDEVPGFVPLPRLDE
jgi:hypothetical protein